MGHITARVALVAVGVLFLTASVFGAQQRFTIAKIEFEGLNRLAPEQVLATTELKVGQQFELAALDAAAQLLMYSVMFKNVAYKTRASANQMTITFKVEETQLKSWRVIFDNFI